MRRIILLLGGAMLLAGCLGPPRVGAPPIGPDQPEAGGAISAIATWALNLAAIGLIIATPVLAWVGRYRTAATVGGICFTIIVTAPILIWVSAHLLWICGIVAFIGLTCVFIWLWNHREKIDSALGADYFDGPKTGGE